MKDDLFKQPKNQLGDFAFNEDVAEVFDDMLQRSVPFYNEIQLMISRFAEAYYQPKTTLIDLGCSHGSTLNSIAENTAIPPAMMIGIDNSEAMLEKATTRLQPFDGISLICGDIKESPITNASVIILNYTLQFIRPLYREQLIQHIYDSLVPGGILLLSEKVLENSTNMSRMFIQMYYQFKKEQGYSDLEISQKREALENVLIPYKVDEHYELMKKVGFSEVEIFFKWHNFASFIAVKSL